ncbi:MAG TPA: glycosyltransferase [Caulobacteraceae bacterium]|nr:glycosyltransferase [Caulobacteraceae bacterium]
MATRTEGEASAGARLVDTTMLYAPRSGGVKRYLAAKRAWLAARRPHVRHVLVAPGPRHGWDEEGRLSIYAAPLPFGDGYRWPVSKTAWMKRLVRQAPDVIEAGDPYTPGLAALKAGAALGVPVIGFCHTDLAALAALHIGDWAERPVRRHWAEIYRRFDAVIAPSRYIAERLADSGVSGPVALPLGVDPFVFHPGRGDRALLRRRLGLAPSERLLVFAGRPAREKRIDLLIDAVESLGAPYRLLLIGAAPPLSPSPSPRVIDLPYQSEALSMAHLLASCDAFVHANDTEAFGLVVLEAMACGLPVVGVAAGGVAEIVDSEVGELAAGASAPALAEAITALFSRDTGAIGAAARARILERHSWDAVFERLSTFYGSITGLPAFAPEPFLRH